MVKISINENRELILRWLLFPQESRFTECTICVHVKEQLNKPHVLQTQRQQLGLMRKIHLTQQL